MEHGGARIHVCYKVTEEGGTEGAVESYSAVDGGCGRHELQGRGPVRLCAGVSIW